MKSLAAGKPIDQPDPNGEAISVAALFAVFRRCKWLIAAFAAAGALAGALVGQQITPKYMARAMLVVEPHENMILGKEAAVPGLSTDYAALSTQLEVIRSPALAARVVDDLDLSADPEFNPSLRDGGGSLPAAGAALERLLARLPNEWLIAAGLADVRGASGMAERVAVAPEAARRRAIEAFRRRLQVSNDGASYIIRIGFTSSDPAKAALIANRTANLHIEAHLQSKRSASGDTSAWLDDRIEQLRGEVRAAESAVERFRAENDLVGVNGASLSEAELSDVNKELLVARAAMAEKQAKLRLAKELRGRGELDALAEVAASPVIIDLRRQEAQLLQEEGELALTYGERHPRRQELAAAKANMARKIADEVARIVRALENEAQALAIRIRAMEAELGTVKAANSRNREAEVRLRELERNAAATRQLYETLLQRFKELGAQQDSIRPDLWLLSPAEPPNGPSSPSPKLLAVSGFAIGSIFGALFALVRERSDRGLRGVSEFQDALGLPVLSLIPEVKRLKLHRNPHDYLRAKPMSAYGEAIRAVHAALRLADGGRPPQVVLVTSALPGEGKTTFAISLAVFAARLQQRTLLVDLDMRHPRIAAELNQPVHAPLANSDWSHDMLHNAVRHNPWSAEIGVDVLSLAGSAEEPVELLLDPLLDPERLALLLGACRQHYDLVILDSAPVVGVSETALMARLADEVIFVVRWGETPAEVARAGSQALRDAGASLGGVAVTRVDLQKHAQYGYHDVAQYYGSSKYNKYYLK